MTSPFSLDAPHLPLVAILRGLTPDRAAEVGRILYANGFRLLEVPLNRDGALEAIATMVRTLPADAWIGAGTVLRPEQVGEVAEVGGRLIVSPNTHPPVLAAARERGMWTLPGVATPTEAFNALAAGAHALKLFPAEVLAPAVVKTWSNVLPPGTAMYPVGSVDGPGFAAYRAAGAAGIGLGSALFKPEYDDAELARRASRLAQAWHGAGSA